MLGFYSAVGLPLHKYRGNLLTWSLILTDSDNSLFWRRSHDERLGSGVWTRVRGWKWERFGLVSVSGPK